MPDRRRPSHGPAWRRAAAQRALLGAVLLVTVLGSALVGTGALLVGPGLWTAVDSAAAAAERSAAAPAEQGTGRADLVTVTAGTTDTRDASDAVPPGARTTVDELRPLLLDALAPLDATLSVWVSTPPARLPGDAVRRGYLLDADTLTEHATLVQGRWPAAGTGTAAAPLEVAVPRATAELLGLTVGDALTLGATPGTPSGAGTGGTGGTALVVVGVLEPDASSSWRRDRLRGAGTDTGGALALTGPFVVPTGALLAEDAPVGRLSVEADAELTGHPRALGPVARRLTLLDDAVGTALGDDVAYATVDAALPRLVDDGRGRLTLTTSTVLTALLLVVTLTGAALALLARLLAARRSADTALLVDRGASRRQLAAAAGVEGLVLSLAATVLAVPLAAAGYALLTRVGPAADAWELASPLRLDAAAWGLLVGCVAACTLALATVGVVLAVRGAGGGRPRRHAAAGTVARSGADVLLVALAVLGYQQLRAHRLSLDAPDPVLVLAPALCLVAAAALTLRAVGPVARVAEVAARRGRGLAVPLAGWQVARGRTAAGVFLAALAASSATFAVSFQATWVTSQHDQADAAVGADVRVAADGSPGQGERLAGSATSAVPDDVALVVAAAANRSVTLGSRAGGGRLVAIDTRQAGTLVRGRLDDGAGWAGLTAGLPPDEPVAALVVHGDRVPVEVTGGFADADGTAPASVSLVLEGEHGERVVVPGPDVVLDGRPHRGTVVAPADATWRVIGAHVVVEGGTDLPEAAEARLEVAVRVPGAQPSAGTWTAFGDADALTGQAVATTAADAIGFTAAVSVFSLGFSTVDVVVAGFPPTARVPVLAAAPLADALGLAPGDTLDLGVGGTVLPAVVDGIAPYVPAAGDEAAVLADVDAVSRALIERGELGTVDDEWWIATAHPDEVAAATGGTSRTALGRDLATGPLHAAAPVALGLLVVAAVVLALAGAGARELGVAHERTLEAARLRALGVPRRMLTATATARHVLVTVLALGLGVLAGAVLALALGPALVVARDGGAPVPPAVAVWPGGAEAAVLAVLVVGCVLVGLPPARALARRSTASSLRTGDAG
ncbi:hypothetical protein KIN34_03325 [Cellulomonas sp. DKR-3]|uniref:ABC3 transporter permease protein domain-containing protein n=1 Tax=Cellulomonas fulva TaxID=2835530 RepID=A0ABS5TVY6_9CELL|nr:hypothetical protein [Cellulomonas fulva]MBT0993317.1 hypothetical protein [Cellulomonas fulva]